MHYCTIPIFIGTGTLSPYKFYLHDGLAAYHQGWLSDKNPKKLRRGSLELFNHHFFRMALHTLLITYFNQKQAFAESGNVYFCFFLKGLPDYLIAL